MTARYHVITTNRAMSDLVRIQNYLQASGLHFDKVDDFEAGYFTFLDGLSKLPHHPIVEQSTERFPESVRRALYRMSKRSIGYHLYFVIEEAERPDPEPESDYFAGVVRIIAIRHASAAPMSDEEITSRRN
jgi:hypothetical protein